MPDEPKPPATIRIQSGIRFGTDEKGLAHASLLRDLDDEWRVELQLAIGDGRLVVSELHLRPRAGAAGIHAPVPKGGINKRLLLRVPVHAHVQAFGEALRNPSQRRFLEGLGAPAVDALLGVPSASPPLASRTGRPSLTVEQLLRVAVAYADAVDAKSRQPIQDAAARLKMTATRVRDLVHRCRRPDIDLLTKTDWGFAGGSLTARARALLKEEKVGSPTSRRKNTKRRKR